MVILHVPYEMETGLVLNTAKNVHASYSTVPLPSIFENFDAITLEKIIQKSTSACVFSCVEVRFRHEQLRLGVHPRASATDAERQQAFDGDH